MQIKTIQKIIVKKMNEWLSTITDETLREKVKENLLVSGGAICSMLLGIQVNDFDIYIKDKTVLMSLVDYYVKNFDGITVLDGAEKEAYTQDMKNKYRAESEEEIFNRYSVAIKNLKPDQIKLFFGNTNGGMKVNEDKKPEELNYSPVFFSPNAISLSNDIQIVNRFHGDNVQIHKTFDFIHATNYFTFETGLVTNKEALESLITRQLKYQGSMYPLTSIIRMKKFLKRDWNISSGEILKIMFQISELDLSNPDVLEDQLIGVDVAYYSQLIDAMRVSGQEKVTSEFINTLIDKIFNNAEEGE